MRRRRQPTDDTALTMLVINPYGKPSGYSGPAKLANNLFGSLGPKVVVDLITSAEAARGVYPWARATYSRVKASAHQPPAQALFALYGFVRVLLIKPKPQVIHTHGAYIFTLLPASAGFLRGIPVAVLPLAEGGDINKTSQSNRIPGVASLRRVLMARLSLGLALSDGIAHDLEQAGLQSSRVHRLPNIADRSFYAYAESRKFNPDSRTLLFVGQIGQRKGAELVLDTLAALRKSGYDARAQFVGPFKDASIEASFRSRVRKLNLAEVVECTGYVEDVSKHMDSDANIFILPSKQEGMPGALCEALAAGLPCLVTDVGSMGEIVSASGAGMVIARDPENIKEAVLELWENPALLTAMSDRARAYALDHFSPAAVAKEYTRLMRELVMTKPTAEDR